MGSYIKGEPVRLSATFVVDGTPTDPTTVTFRVRPFTDADVVKAYPGDPEVVRDSAGAFHFDVETDAGPEGTWYYRVEGTAPAIGAAEGNFFLATAFE